MDEAPFPALDVFRTPGHAEGPKAALHNTAKGKLMSQETYELKAEARERVGKGSSRELRRNGLIPAVIYGDNKNPVAIALTRKDVAKKLQDGGFMTTVATLDVNGDKYRVLPKDYQLDPVRDFILHVDFLRVSATTQVQVAVPVHFINEEKSPGIKRGGVLNIVRHEVDLNCSADSIPDSLVVDLTGMEIGDSVHISAITLPTGVTPTIGDRDFTIATIASPAGLKSEDNASSDEEADADATEESEEEQG